MDFLTRMALVLGSVLVTVLLLYVLSELIQYRYFKHKTKFFHTMAKSTKETDNNES